MGYTLNLCVSSDRLSLTARKWAGSLEVGKQGLLAESCFFSLAAQGLGAPPHPSCKPLPPRTLWNLHASGTPPFRHLHSCESLQRSPAPLHTPRIYYHLPIGLQMHLQFAIICGEWQLAPQGSWAGGKSQKPPGKDECSEPCRPTCRAWRHLSEFQNVVAGGSSVQKEVRAFPGYMRSAKKKRR